MKCYTARECLIPRSLDKVICLFESETKVWIIIYISESIVIWKERESWRRDFFVWIEVPVIVIDIIRSEIKDISFVEGKCDNRSWKSSICTDFITILIENHIPLWLFMSEHFLYIFTFWKVKINNLWHTSEKSCNFFYLFPYFRIYMDFSIDFTCTREFISNCFYNILIFLEIVCRCIYTERWKEIDIFCFSTILWEDRISLVDSSFTCSWLWKSLENEWKSLCYISSPLDSTSSKLYMILWYPWKWYKKHMTPLESHPRRVNRLEHLSSSHLRRQFHEMIICISHCIPNIKKCRYCEKKYSQYCSEYSSFIFLHPPLCFSTRTTSKETIREFTSIEICIFLWFFSTRTRNSNFGSFEDCLRFERIEFRRNWGNRIPNRIMTHRTNIEWTIWYIEWFEEIYFHISLWSVHEFPLQSCFFEEESTRYIESSECDKSIYMELHRNRYIDCFTSFFSKVIHPCLLSFLYRMSRKWRKKRTNI